MRGGFTRRWHCGCALVCSGAMRLLPLAARPRCAHQHMPHVILHVILLGKGNTSCKDSATETNHKTTGKYTTERIITLCITMHTSLHTKPICHNK